MKKTSLYLEAELDRSLARRAAEQGVSKAEYIRQTLREASRPKPPRRPRGRGSFSGPPDLAERLDDHLAEDGYGEG